MYISNKKVKKGVVYTHPSFTDEKYKPFFDFIEYLHKNKHKYGKRSKNRPKKST